MASPAGPPDLLPLSGDPRIDMLVQGSYWEFSGDRVITWSIGHNDTSFLSPSPALAAAVGQALAAWSAVADITFEEIDSGGLSRLSTANIAIELRGSEYSGIAAALFPDAGLYAFDETYYPNPEGDVFLRASDPSFAHLTPGEFGFFELVHEFGHALGLKHPHEDGERDRPTSAELGIQQLDNRDNTVMSYSSTGDAGISGGNPATPLLFDILAIQSMYGANMSYRTGDDTYVLAADGVVRAIWDAGGSDTLDASGLSKGLAIDLRAGGAMSYGTSTSKAVTAIAYGVGIENAIGTGFDDTITGNDLANVLDGRAGTDWLQGGLGGDTYLYSLGGGWDTIEDLDASTGGIDVLWLGAGILPGDLQVLRQDDDLLLRINGHAQDQIDLVKAASGDHRIEQVRFDDGTVWSAATLEAHVSEAGSYPVLIASAGSVIVNRWNPTHSIELASLLQVTDADGDPIMGYQFRDQQGGGALVINGSTQFPEQNIDVAAADLAAVEFRAGETIGNETVRVRATDGAGWTAWVNIDIATVANPNHLPVVLQSNASVGLGETVALATLFSTTDADGDAITGFQVRDNSAGGGYFTYDGFQQDAGGFHGFSASQLDHFRYVGGSGAGTETFSIAVSDGKDWSDIGTFTLATVAIHAPVITGTATQGQTLTASNSASDIASVGAIGYQWTANGSAISGATGATLVLAEAQVGKLISVIASYTDGLGTPGSLASSATSAVANVNDSPTGSVTISGTPTQGQTLAANNTLGDLDGVGTIGYQWKADGSDIVGATTGILVLAEAQVGKAITVAASYTDGHGTAESATSGATAAVVNVNDSATGTVTISGNTLQGQTLTASHALGDLDGLGTIGYQWKSDGINIVGATGSTLVLAAAQVGKAITVAASYTDGHGTAESVTSEATSAVRAPNTASPFNDIYNGTAGADTFDGLAGADIINGNAGDDRLTGGAGSDALDGGAGIDTAVFSGVRANYAVLSGGAALIFTDNVGTDGSDSLLGFERVQFADGTNFYGTAAADRFLAGAAGESFFYGFGGNDTYTIASGNNTIFGGDGANKVTTGAGNDTINTGAGNDTISAGAGTNVINAGEGANKITTLEGNDTITSGAGGDTISAGAGANVINAGAGANKITTGDGSDAILSGIGNDTITAGAGTNVINAGDGANKITTGDGNDAILSGIGNDTITAGAGDNFVAAGDGANKVTTLAGDDTIVTGNGIDTIAAGEGDNTVVAGGGNDKVTTGGGDDRIYGEAGNDTITAGAGNDILAGGDGNDVLTGGLGADIFRFDTAPNATTNLDRITDFLPGTDKIELENAIFTALAEADALPGGEFRGGAGIVSAADADDHLLYNSSTGALYYDADGTGLTAAVQIARLASNLALGAADFVVS